jgi:hypothetical protein
MMIHNAKTQADYLLTVAEQQMIASFQAHDEHFLLLKKKQTPLETFIHSQIAYRKKAIKKLPELCASPAWIFHSQRAIEQASSEPTAKFKAQLISGASCIDLTAGMGVDAYYIAQQVNHLTVVEPNEQLSKTTEHNLALHHPQKHIETACMDAASFLLHYTVHTDWIFIDPDRRTDHQRHISLQSYHPNVTALLPTMLERSHNILIKTSPLLDVQVILKQLSYVNHIYALTSQDECKELLIHVKKNWTYSPILHAINLDYDWHTQHNMENETNLTVSFAYRGCLSL